MISIMPFCSLIALRPSHNVSPCSMPNYLAYLQSGSCPWAVTLCQLCQVDKFWEFSCCCHFCGGLFSFKDYISWWSLVMRPAWIWTVRRRRANCSTKNRRSRKSQQKGKFSLTTRTYCHVKLRLTKLQIFIHNVASVFTDLFISNFT